MLSVLCSNNLTTKWNRGIAINCFNHTQLKTLEEAQNKCIRKIYGASGKTSNKVMLHLAKLPTMRSLKAMFGQDAVLVFGDWSAPNVKYQEPTRSKGLIRMLKKNGFVVYLMNTKHLPIAQPVKMN